MNIMKMYKNRKIKGAKKGTLKYSFLTDANKLFNDEKLSLLAVSFFELLGIYSSLYFGKKDKNGKPDPKDDEKAGKAIYAAANKITRKMLKRVEVTDKDQFSEEALAMDQHVLLAKNSVACFYIATLRAKDNKEKATLFDHYMVELKILFKQFELTFK